MDLYLLIALSLLIGLLIGYLIGKVQIGRLETRLELQQQESQRLQQEYQRQHDEAQRQVDDTIQRVADQMQQATSQMLHDRQEEFAASSHQNLGQIVAPLRETMERMQRALADNAMMQTSMSSELRVHIENMMRQSEAAQQSATELARALRHGTKVQGDWGETVLDELLQSQGLTRGIHYDTQMVLRDAQGNVLRSADGQTMRPDVVMHLDQRRELIIDSKVSLTAYIDYVNAETESERQAALAAHVNSLRKHVKELAAKDYSSYIVAPKVRMDYVIMFVPHAGALWTALNAQPDLWRRAMERNVFIADEQTLFAALRIIHLTWTQITQVQQHERVYKLAEEMIDRVGQFCHRYQQMGAALQKAQEAYDEGLKKLDPQGHSIVGTANKLIRLGAKQSVRNPIPLSETDKSIERPDESEPEA